MPERKVDIRGDWLKQVRERHRLGLEEVAKLANCSRRSVIDAEGGRATVGLGTRIAEVLGLSFESLRKGSPGLLTKLVGLPPQRPELIVGREKDIACLQEQFDHDLNSDKVAIQAISAVRGWPGVGKTTLAAEMAHLEETRQRFPEGILWTSLGQNPDVRHNLMQWMRAFGDILAEPLNDVNEISRRLAGHLLRRRMLLIIDDVWRAEDGYLFLVGGSKCGMLVTTRLPSVADDLTPTLGRHYHLDLLDEEHALQLLRFLAPKVVKESPEACLDLVRTVDRLPLALQVAGRMLQSESQRGLSVTKLLKEIRGDAKLLLESPAPVGMANLLGDSTPTIAALLRKSIDTIPEELRERFILLSDLPEEPATFDVPFFSDVWEITDAEAASTLRSLADRGLMELAAQDRYKIHAILVLLARSLCEEE